MPDTDNQPAAAYVAWGTFNNTLDQLAQGVPNRIDKSVFPGLSGGVQSQLLAGLKFLGLIDDDGKPQPALEKLATADEAARKIALCNVLEDRYADLFAIDLTNATPAQLGEAMGESYNVSGATREKAVRFFLSAAEFAEVPLSTLLRGKRRAATGTRSVRRKAARKKTPNRGAGAAPPPASGGTAKTVRLQSGGTLTLSASLDLFSLNAADRGFVFELIDRMESYQEPVEESQEQTAEDAEEDANGEDT